MVLDLKGFINGGARTLAVDATLDYTVEEYYGCHPFKQPVRVVGSVTNKAEVTRLLLHFPVQVFLPCDRCGRDTEKTVEVTVDRVLVTALEGEDDGDYLLLPDEKLDLYAVCLEEIILSLPSKFLCKSDCKGACPVCGRNLNDGDCNCKR